MALSNIAPVVSTTEHEHHSEEADKTHLWSLNAKVVQLLDNKNAGRAIFPGTSYKMWLAILSKPMQISCGIRKTMWHLPQSENRELDMSQKFTE